MILLCEFERNWVIFGTGIGIIGEGCVGREGRMGCISWVLGVIGVIGMVE